KKGAGVLKNVPRDVIAVRPHADLGIVVDVGAETVSPHVIRAGRIWCRRHREALGELPDDTGPQRQSYLTDHPAVGNAVVLHTRIAESTQLVARGRRAPERAVVDG